MHHLIEDTKALLEHWQPIRSDVSLRARLLPHFPRRLVDMVPQASSNHERIYLVVGFLYEQGYQYLIDLLGCVADDGQELALQSEAKQLMRAWRAEQHARIQVVAVTMTRGQADELLEWLGKADQGELRRHLGLHGDRTLQRYISSRYHTGVDLWRPFGDQLTVPQLVENFAAHYRAQWPHTDCVYRTPQLCSHTFAAALTDHAAVQEMFRAERGIVLVDALSAFHPIVGAALRAGLAAAGDGWCRMLISPLCGALARLHAKEQQIAAALCPLLGTPLIVPSDLAGLVESGIADPAAFQRRFAGIYRELLRLPTGRPARRSGALFDHVGIARARGIDQIGLGEL